jgi:hypothetical protein
MGRIIKSISIGLITLVLSLNIFIVCTPTTLAGPLDKVYECQYVCDVDYDKAAAEAPFLPVDMTIDIPLIINVRVSGIYSEVMMPYYLSRKAFAEVYLNVNHTPSWCTATISPYNLFLDTDADWVSTNATLHIKVDENAYAFQDGTVEIEIDIRGIGAILGRIFYVSIPFRPGYLPLLKINTDDTNRLIAPMDTANFDIGFENIGNAKTNVTFRVLNQPEEWEISIDPNTIVGTRNLGDNPKKTVVLTVRPPYGLGYHQDREVIQISMLPSYYNNSQLKGQEYLLSFIVQSRGFSTPGFEGVFVIFALIGVALIAKNRQKTSKYSKTSKKRGNP